MHGLSTSVLGFFASAMGIPHIDSFGDILGIGSTSLDLKSLIVAFVLLLHQGLHWVYEYVWKLE